MRKRELIRDKRKSAKTIGFSYETVARYVEACQCPYCQDGKVYKMLPLHIYQIHRITAYEFREMYGMNRTHKLSSSKTSELMREKAKQRDKAAWLKYDRKKAVEFRYQDGGQRDETIRAKRIKAQQEETKLRFAEAMTRVDRRKVAERIDPAIRSFRASHAARSLWVNKTKEERSQYIVPIRAKRTEESKKVARANANKTMRLKYFNNPIWYSQWKHKLRKSKQAKAKVPRHEYPKIVQLYNNGMTQARIATCYGVSGGMIYLIIKSHRLGLSTLHRTKSLALLSSMPTKL